MRAVLIGQLVFVLAVVGLWQGLVWAGVDPFLLPPVTSVAAFVGQFLVDPAFLADLGITGLEVLLAFAIAVPFAIATGFALGERASLAASVNPFIYVVLAVPQSVFLPIFILAFGIGFLEKVIFGITHAYFVIVMNTSAAVRSVPPSFVVAARSFGATRAQIYLRIYLPAMLPLVLTGLRLGMNFCIIGVLLAEMYASRHGIGHRLFGWGEAYQVAQLLAGIVIVSVLTILVNEALRVMEVRAARRYGTLQR
jgi:NitT/TauT family transport system permease protein